MMSLCECGEEAVVICNCTKAKLCQKHIQTHLEAPGRHRIIEINPQGSAKNSQKSVSFKKSNTTESKKSDSVQVKSPKQLSEDSKTRILAALTKEQNRIHNFKDLTLDCLNFYSETLINKIITETKQQSAIVNRECMEKEEMLLAALEELEKTPGKDLPKNNPMIERIREGASDEKFQLFTATYSIQQVEFKYTDIIKADIQWTPIEVIEPILQYFKQNDTKITGKIRELYTKIKDENHYGLKRINISKSKCGPEGAAHLALIMPQLTQVEILKMADNDLGEEGAEILAEPLMHLGKVQKLDLAHNSIRGKGMQSISQALVNMQDLHTLFLAHSSLGATGARHLSFCLQNLTKMKHLDLDENSLGAEGARNLASILPRLPQLKILKLRDNNLGTDSCKFLLSALGRLNKLEMLKMEHNLFTAEDKKQLASVVRRGCKVDF